MVAKHIFISHASQDRRLAESIKAGLEDNGLVVWMAPDRILPGVSYAESIMNAINESIALVVILSAAANVSPHVLREVERAVDKSVPLLPVRIEEFQLSSGMEYLLSTCQWLDAVGERSENLPAQMSSILKQWTGGGKVPAGPETQPVQDLTITITTAAAFDLDIDAVVISRGNLESGCALSKMEYMERRLRVGRAELVEIISADKQRAPRVFLYPDKVAKVPDEESLRLAVMDLLLSIQLESVTRVGVVPTGRALGVPRIIALRATLRGYIDYLDHPRSVMSPRIRVLYFSVPELRDASYELGLLYRELRKTFMPQSKSNRHYVSAAEEWSEDPKSLQVTLAKKS